MTLNRAEKVTPRYRFDPCALEDLAVEHDVLESTVVKECHRTMARRPQTSGPTTKMVPWFLLSYGRRDDVGGALVTRFYKSLVNAVAQKAAIQTQIRPEKIGFFDQSMETGTHWPNGVSETLASCRTLVCLISRSYIESQYCGKELQIFTARLESSGNQRSPLILPIAWDSFAWSHGTLPEALSNIYFPVDGPGQAYEEEGLVGLVRRGQHEKFVRRFAEHLVSVAEEFPLPSSAQIQPFDMVPSVFHSEAFKPVNGRRPRVESEIPPPAAATNPREGLATDVDHEERFLRFLRSSFRPHGEFLRRQIGEPVFFLAVHPLRWEPTYCGLPNDLSEANAREIHQRCETLRQDLADRDILAPWEILDRVAKSFLADVRLSPPDLMRGAISILLSDAGLPLGYEGDSEGKQQPHTAFRLEHGTWRTPGWFQDALDLAGTFRFSGSAFRERRKDRDEEDFCDLLPHPSHPGRVLALRVRNYMRRTGLLRDRFQILLAEYLLFKTQHADGKIETDIEPSQLDHLFLPLRSNGQWRTAACWFSADNEAAAKGISSEIQEQLGARCSQTYWEGFSTTLHAGLRSLPAEERGANALYGALSVLWWGFNFWFYRGDEIVLSIMTSYPDMKHIVAQVKEHRPPTRTGEFFTVRRHSHGEATLIINLSAIPGGRGPKVVAALAVEVVEIYVRLFDLEEHEKAEVAEQLALRILQAI